MRRAVCLALVALGAGACGGGSGEPAAVDEGSDWSVVEPADAGLDAAALERADRRIRQDYPAVRSLLVARDGRLGFERYYGGAGPEAQFEVYSITKSVVSALVGIALADGRLRGVDQRLVEFFPQYASGADPRLPRLTLDDLLSMKAGYSPDPIQSSANWMKTLMHRRFVHEPGTAFEYDGGSTHLLSGVLTKATGRKAADLARERIFEPLGIESGWAWPDDGQGVSVGGDGLTLRARDLAKLGQLYLQEGDWGGERIPPASWVRESTRIHTRIGAPRRGYGYQWWVNDVPKEKGYAALGYGGQTIVVLPALDLVVVVTTAPIEDVDATSIVYGLIVPAAKSR